MAYSLFDFYETKSVEVGNSAWIVWEDDKPSELTDIHASQRVVRVRWPESTKSRARGKQLASNKKVEAKIHPARILQFGGKFWQSNDVQYKYLK